jgi:hypothetical protein
MYANMEDRLLSKQKGVFNEVPLSCGVRVGDKHLVYVVPEQALGVECRILAKRLGYRANAYSVLVGERVPISSTDTECYYVYVILKYVQEEDTCQE